MSKYITIKVDDDFHNGDCDKCLYYDNAYDCGEYVFPCKMGFWSGGDDKDCKIEDFIKEIHEPKFNVGDEVIISNEAFKGMQAVVTEIEQKDISYYIKSKNGNNYHAEESMLKLNNESDEKKSESIFTGAITGNPQNNGIHTKIKFKNRDFNTDCTERR